MSKLPKTENRLSSFTQAFLTTVTVILVIVSFASYLSFALVLQARVSIGNDRSELVAVYAAKSLFVSGIIEYLDGQKVESPGIAALASNLGSTIQKEIRLRPATANQIPDMAIVANSLVKDGSQFRTSVDPMAQASVISDIMSLNKRLNVDAFALNMIFNKELSALAKKFYGALALSLISFLYLLYTALLMRTTFRKISNLTKVVVEKISLDKPLDIPAKEILAPSKLLPGADLVISETVKLAEMYRVALVKERELYDDQKELTEKVQATVTELEAAREETFRSAQLSAIGKVAGSVSHEINNPITGILGYIAYVRKKTADQDLVKYLDKAQKEVERIGRIAKSLLVFSRHYATLPAAKFELASTVENVAVLVDPQLHDSMVELDIAPMIDMPPVIGRVDEYQQCILNMILNARDALKDWPERKIWLTARLIGANVELLITDSGKGVPDDFREFLFQPFHTTKPAGEGSGLGLSVCRELMNRMGGTATFDPSYGPGARFILSLPVYVEPKVESTQAQPAAIAEPVAKAEPTAIA